jgi:hypothetical protein
LRSEPAALDLHLAPAHRRSAFVTLHRLYAAFRKSADGKIVVLKNDDGTIQVEGIASSEAVDAQGEVVKSSAIAKALPEYMKFPALREMHQPLAAGKTIAADVAEDGCTYITAKVVDPVAIKKVEEGVYAGFSIGGSVPPGGRSKDNPKIIEQIKLVEISLVDRPANPEAVFTLVKVEEPPAAAPPTVTEPPKPGETTVAAPKTRKGMFTVGWAAELCQQLASLASDTQWEADYEGDDSKIPGRLKTMCVELCDILKDLVAEEADELVAAKGTEAVALLAAPGTLKRTEKLAVLARAILSATGKKPPELPELVELRKRVEAAESATAQAGDALRKVTGERNDLHKKHADALLALKAKGVPRDPKFIESVAKVEALEAALAEATDATEKAGDALRKTLKERDDLKKRVDVLEAALSVNADEAKKRLEDVVDERDELQKQRDTAITELAKANVVLKTKGALKTVPVDKAADVDPVDKNESKPPEGTKDRAEYELRKVHARGPRPLALGSMTASGSKQ